MSFWLKSPWKEGHRILPDILSDSPRNPPKQPVSVGFSDSGGGEDFLDTLTHRLNVQTTPNRNQVDKSVKGTNQDLCDTFNLGDIYIFPSHAPEESSLDIGPSHVDPHVVGLVHQDVVLGAGGQSIAEPHHVLPDVSITWRLGQWHRGWKRWLSFCPGLLIWLGPWTLLWWWDTAVIPILRQTIIHRLKHRNLHNYRDRILDTWDLPDNSETQTNWAQLGPPSMSS